MKERPSVTQAPRWLAPALVLLVGFTLFFFALDATTLWDNDEPTYAEIAKEMVKSGNLITPMFNNEPWFCHPPFYMWLTACAFRLLGWGELTSRLFPSLFAVLGMLVVYRMAARWWGERIGLLAAFILGTSLQYLVQGRMATMDSMLNTFLLFSFYAAWRGLEEKSRRWWHLFFISCALATLAKGVFGLAYPIFILAVYHLMRGDHSWWKGVPWRQGLFLYFLIAAPWFVYETARYGKIFLYQVFYFYTFKRVVSPILRQSGPWYYYIPVLFFGFFPWSGFLPYLSLKSWRWRTDPRVLFLSLWAASTFLFFTLVNTKLPNYIFFLYPPLAMLLAYFWSGLNAKQAVGGLGLTLALCAFLAAGLGWLGLQKLLARELHTYVIKLLPILGILLIGVILALAAEIGLRKRLWAFGILALTITGFWFTLMVRFASTAEAYKPMKPLAQMLRTQRAQEPAPVLAYHAPGTASLIFYSDTFITNLDESKTFLEQWRGGKVYCFIGEGELDRLRAELGPFWTLARRRTTWLITNFNPDGKKLDGGLAFPLKIRYT